MAIIKKIGILVILCFIFFSSPAEAETPLPGRYSFSLSPLFGMLHGQAREIVYRDRSSNQYLSELLWDVKPLIYVGLAADFGPRDPFESHGFIAAASIRFGLPFRSGNHENRDWLNPNETWLTHFSRHDVYIQNAILLDISAGYSWRLTHSLALRAFAEFSFMHFSWSGENGFIQYPAPRSDRDFPPWNNNLPRRNLYGMVIRYSQNWFIFAPGFSLKWRLERRLSLEGRFSYTPLILCSARDDHLFFLDDHGWGRRTFWDYMSFGHYINGGGGLILSPRNNLDITFFILYRHITGTRGITYLQDNHLGQTSRTSTGAGAGFSALDISLAARIRLSGQN